MDGIISAHEYLLATKELMKNKDLEQWSWTTSDQFDVTSRFCQIWLKENKKEIKFLNVKKEVSKLFILEGDRLMILQYKDILLVS
jgi:hypothetical protein